MCCVSESKRKIVFNKYNQRCAYCGCTLEFNKFTVDHIIAKRHGDSIEYLNKYYPNTIKGTDNIENLNPACNSCNSSKATFTIENWKKEILLKHNRLLKSDSTYRLLHRFNIIKTTKKEFKFYFETL